MPLKKPNHSSQSRPALFSWIVAAGLATLPDPASIEEPRAPTDPGVLEADPLPPQVGPVFHIVQGKLCIKLPPAKLDKTAPPSPAPGPVYPCPQPPRK